MASYSDDTESACTIKLDPIFPADLVNKVICSDCKLIIQRIPTSTIDLTITSPPYDDLRNYGGYSFDFERIAWELFRITKPGGVLVWISGDATVNGSETGTSFRQALFFKQLGFFLHDTMIYEKSAFANPSNNRYHQIFEYMFILSKGQPKTFHPIKDRKNKTQYDFGRQRRNKDGSMTNSEDTSRIKLQEYGKRFNIWRYVTGRGNTTKDDIAFNHPAVFPEKLAEDHIISWSNEGDIILDPMCGSGTTLKMAIKNGRNYIGIDISQEYVNISKSRIEIMKKGIENRRLQMKIDDF